MRSKLPSLALIPRFFSESSFPQQGCGTPGSCACAAKAAGAAGSTLTPPSSNAAAASFNSDFYAPRSRNTNPTISTSHRDNNTSQNSQPTDTDKQQDHQHRSSSSSDLEHSPEELRLKELSRQINQHCHAGAFELAEVCSLATSLLIHGHVVTAASS